MKKLLLAMLLTTNFAIVGCGGAKKEEPKKTDAPPATTPATEPAKTP